MSQININMNDVSCALSDVRYEVRSVAYCLYLNARSCERLFKQEDLISSAGRHGQWWRRRRDITERELVMESKQ